MQKYDITGMSCAACSSRIEKAVSALDAVEVCSVNLLTNSMTVEGSAAPDLVIAAVERAGYGASVAGSKGNADDVKKEDKETKSVALRLIASLVFLVPLMYVSMGHTMWNFPLPKVLADSHLSLALVEMILAAVVMIINQKFFVVGFKGLVSLAPNMDTLIAIGSLASYLYSTAYVFVMAQKVVSEDVSHYLHGLYFESAAMILVLITVGKMLEAHSKGKTTDAIKSLMKLTPETVCVLRDGAEATVPVSEASVGEIAVVREGESIGVDARVIEGAISVNEASLTGESIPTDKAEGDKVSAGTLCTSGYAKCEITGVGEDTALSKIIKMVSDAAATKAPIAKAADKVSGVFVPVVIAIAAVCFAVWLLLGKDVGFALSRATAVLVVSCPCALGLATPVAIMVGSGKGARNGILVKTAEALETAGRIDIVALDKTGTVTTGEPVVTDVISAEDVYEEELLSVAYSLESKSSHPLAQAVVRYAEEKGAHALETDEFKSLAGSGVEATADGSKIRAGNGKFISRYAKIPADMSERADELAENGKTPLYFAVDDKIIGIIAVMDKIKEDSREAVVRMKNMGLRVVMLTGDNEKTAKAVARTAEIDEVVSGVRPDEKADAVKKLRRRGKVAMVGDGINDAPALTEADLGVAIGAGTDVARDAADAVLMKSKLSDVAALVSLGRRSLRVIHQNLFWAFVYNSFGIPLAAGAFIGLFGWELKPMFAALAMSLSSFCVVTNALRLNFAPIYNERKDIKIKKKEKKTMTKTMKIEGMMCPHCEARVKKTLEAIEGVEAAEVSHERGEAVVTLSAKIADETLKKAVEDQDYTVLEIK